MSSTRTSAWQKFTVNGAARLFGCSAAHLRRLRTLGWIRAVEDRGRRSPVPFAKCHFYRGALEQLAWDYMFSLSFMDIVQVRTGGWNRDVVTAYRGIPRMVVELILHSEAAGEICNLVKSHSDQRLLITPRVIELKTRRRIEFDSQARGRRQDRLKNAGERKLTEAAFPLSIIRISAVNYYDSQLLERAKLKRRPPKGSAP